MCRAPLWKTASSNRWQYFAKRSFCCMSNIISDFNMKIKLCIDWTCVQEKKREREKMLNMYHRLKIIILKLSETEFVNWKASTSSCTRLFTSPATIHAIHAHSVSSLTGDWDTQKGSIGDSIVAHSFSKLVIEMNKRREINKWSSSSEVENVLLWMALQLASNCGLNIFLCVFKCLSHKN